MILIIEITFMSFIVIIYGTEICKNGHYIKALLNIVIGPQNVEIRL